MKNIYICLIGLTFLVALWGFPKLAVPRSLHEPQKRFDVEDRARQTLIQIFGGVFFLGTAYTAWRSLKVNEDNARTTQENLRLAQANLRLLEENARRTRELELYKVAFPKKFEVASDIMNKAREATDVVRLYFASDPSLATTNEFSRAAREKSDGFSNTTDTNRWLFEPEFIGFAWDLAVLLDRNMFKILRCNLGGTTKDIDDKAKAFNDFTSASHEIILKMASALRKELHVTRIITPQD